MTVQDWFEKRKQAQIQRRKLEGRVELDMDPNLWNTRSSVNAFIVMPSF